MGRKSDAHRPTAGLGAFQAAGDTRGRSGEASLFSIWRDAQARIPDQCEPCRAASILELNRVQFGNCSLAVRT
jgi:hypothetical protein